MVDTVGEMALRSAVVEDAVAASVFSVSLAEKPIRLTVFFVAVPVSRGWLPASPVTAVARLFHLLRQVVAMRGRSTTGAGGYACSAA